MQDRPDKTTLLAEVARFLEEQVRPAIDDKGLAYRVRVAAFLVGVVAREDASEHLADPAHLAALLQLLGGGDLPADIEERREAIRAAEAEVARRLRDGDLPIAQALPVLKAVLAGKLKVSNPRFDLSDTFEG